VTPNTATAGKPGRPRKPTAPRTENQAALAAALADAERVRDEAAAAQLADKSVAAELALLAGELAVAAAWSAYLRAQGNHAPALKYGELGVKLAGRIAALRELEAADKLDRLVARQEREDALASTGGAAFVAAGPR
jgi:hypothetical protein